MLPFADHVICLDGRGGIAACGTPSEVQDQLIQHINKLSLHSEQLAGVGGGGSSSSEGQQNKLIGFFRLLTQLDLTKGRPTTSKHINKGPVELRASTTTTTTELDISATLSSINDTLTVASAVDVRTSNNILVGDTTTTELNPTNTTTPQPSPPATDAAASPIVLLVDKEGKAAGGVGWEVYWFYIKSCGGVLAGIVLLVSTISVSVSAFFNNLALG